jgi:PKD repeat protein
VVDGRGGTATGTVNITVTRVNDLPTATFTVDVASGTAPLSVTVDASGSTDVEGLAGYAWTFGDGSTATGVRAQHVFSSAGTFAITLTVTDTDGAKASTTRTVTVTVTAAATRDSVTLHRTGSTSYDVGGVMDSGDVVLKRSAKGVLVAVAGTGRIGTRSMVYALVVSNGMATGLITVTDSTTRLIDAIPVLQAPIIDQGGSVNGTVTWKIGGKAQGLTWSVRNLKV